MIRPERIRERLRTVLLLSTGLAAGIMDTGRAQAQPAEPAQPVPPPTAPDSPPVADLNALRQLPLSNLADVGVKVPFGFIIVRQSEAIAASLVPMQGETHCPERIVLPYVQARHEEQYTHGYPEESAVLSQQRGEAVCVFYVEIVPITLFRGRALLNERRSVRAKPVPTMAWSHRA